MLYGTTYLGGNSHMCFIATDEHGCGTVFSLTPPASSGGAWTETMLHSFGDGRDGAYPNGGLVVGSGGVLYGNTTTGGGGGVAGSGCGGEGCGTAFKLKP